MKSMKVMKLQDRTLFSFEISQYRSATDRAVNAVYEKFKPRIEAKLHSIYKSFEKIRTMFQERGTENFRYAAGRMFSELPLSTSNLPLSESAEAEIKRIMRDLPSFLHVGEEEYGEPFFPENRKAFREYAQYAAREHRISGTAETKNEGRIQLFLSKNISSHSEFTRKLKQTRAVAKSTNSPIVLMLLLQTAGFPDTQELFYEMEDALYENGFPNLKYRGLVTEQIPNVDIAEKMEERLAGMRATRETSVYAKRQINAATFALETYSRADFSDSNEQNKLRKWLKGNAQIMKVMSWQQDFLDEIFQEELSENANRLMDFVYRVSGTSVVTSLVKLQNDVEIKDFFDAMWATLRGHPKYYSEVKDSRQAIEDQLTNVWFHVKRREFLEAKRRSSEHILELTPRSAYIAVKVLDGKGNVAGYRFQNFMTRSEAYRKLQEEELAKSRAVMDVAKQLQKMRVRVTGPLDNYLVAPELGQTELLGQMERAEPSTEPKLEQKLERELQIEVEDVAQNKSVK